MSENHARHEDEHNNNFCAKGELENTLLSCFFSLSPDQFTILSALIGVLLTNNLTLNQQNSLGQFIMNIGQSISTAAAQAQLLQSTEESNATSDSKDS